MVQKQTLTINKTVNSVVKKHPITILSHDNKERNFKELNQLLHYTLNVYDYVGQIRNTGAIFILGNPFNQTPPHNFSPGVYEIEYLSFKNDLPYDTIYKMRVGKYEKVFEINYIFTHNNLTKITGTSPVPAFVFQALKDSESQVITIPSEVYVSGNSCTYTLEDGTIYKSIFKIATKEVTIYKNGELYTVQTYP